MHTLFQLRVSSLTLWAVPYLHATPPGKFNLPCSRALWQSVLNAWFFFSPTDLGILSRGLILTLIQQLPLRLSRLQITIKWELLERSEMRVMRLWKWRNHPRFFISSGTALRTVWGSETRNGIIWWKRSHHTICARLPTRHWRGVRDRLASSFTMNERKLNWNLHALPTERALLK